MDAAQQLAGYIQGSVPVCRLALVRCNERAEVKESAFWGAASQECEAFYVDFLSKRLAELMAVYSKEGRIEDDTLKTMVESSMGGRRLDYDPTLFPIAHDHEILGFAYFGKESGPWTDQEKGALKLLVTIISISFANKNSHDNLLQQNWAINAIMDSMRVNIYVTDPKTDQILFMNRTMKDAFGLDNPEGEICWKVLQKGMTGRCHFCPVRKMLNNPDGGVQIWEEHNSVTGRIYENHDDLIQWFDGSLVHYQQSVDVTDSKLLSRAASVDELTQLLNRRAGKLALQRTLLEGVREKVPVSVCMYDINLLKEINDAYGHAEGDILIQIIADSVRECLKKDDYAFRLSGDEFIIVMKNRDETEAAQVVADIKKRMAEKGEALGKPYTIGFCYGILEVKPEDTLDESEILGRVDERMYEQKRAFHIERAEQKRIRMDERAAYDIKSFQYDTDRLYDALVQSTDDYIYVCNMKTGVFRYPRAMVEEFDLPGEVIENAAAVWGARVHEQDKQAFLEANQEIADGRADYHSVEYRAKNRKGEWVWMRCRGHLERDEKGEPVLFAGMITNLGKKNKIDHLTGLFNKFEFEDQIKAFLEDRPRQRLGIMVLGMDEFKRVNDLYDRFFGDEVIRITSQKIQSLLPESAAVYRRDGDEFAVLFSGASPEDMRAIYENIYQTFNHQQEYGGRKYFCTLSAGCVFYPEDGQNYLELIKHADYSLEYAKLKGKNRLAFFAKNILQHKERALEITELLRTSVENHFQGFELNYQPQIYADTQKLKGAEALCRWRCDEYGSIAPGEFIPLLEESGLIHPVGRWVFDRAIRAYAQCVHKSADFTMSINLSYLQLIEQDFVDFMDETLKKYGVDANNIIVELTESNIVSSIDALAHVFQKIRGLGIRIAMDDFGTGYSSLEILKNCPADVVKIDRAFIRDIRSSTFDATFIRFIVELCHDVGIKVCLEGVETQEEYDIVRPMNLDFIQGFLFGRPMPEEELNQLRH
ncbi:EAL domain-containing protein [Christensenellaceae bacterium NSJ-53]|uniref:EAL domain-containing protein n=2 Tax=Gehongia tenuis TaxID=2763655 RepID=A0A926HQK9_9FIRM|nr:EAL domain-containing protein [Gehongia tenuis]